MAMLTWNAKKVQNLTGVEIWLFILGRVLVAFAVGIFVSQYFPRVGTLLAFAALAIGAVLFAVAAKGLWRKNSG
jgi:Na+/melibiose symporter-like transporter